MITGAGSASTAAGTESRPLPRRSPASMGVRAEAVDEFLDALERDPQIEPHSLMLVRGGAVVAEGWWAPYSAGRVHHLYSLSKTFTATAVGFALAEGRLGLDDRIVDHFPEFADQITAPGSRRIRIRDALAMATGHHRDMVLQASATDPEEPVRGFLLHEPESAPGSWFTYNQPATYAVAAALQRAVGCGLTDYLRPRLLDPLGIGPVAWHEYPPGRAVGFSGLHATTEAVAKLGLLFLREGRWHGRQVLPAGWVADVRRSRFVPESPHPDWSLGYGYQVWRSRHGYRGDGAYGQFCLVLPEHDAVLVTTMGTVRTQAVLDAVWDVLLPGLGSPTRRRVPLQPRAVDHDGRLAQRLDALVLPASSGGPVDDRWMGVHRGTDLTVTIPPPDGNGVCRVAWLEDGRIRLTVPIGTGNRWTVVEPDAECRPDAPPVAVSGGVTVSRDGTPRLRIDLAFLESPHRLYVDVHLSGPERGVSAAWGTAPLRLTDETLLDRGARWPVRG